MSHSTVPSYVDPKLNHQIRLLASRACRLHSPDVSYEDRVSMVLSSAKLNGRNLADSIFGCAEIAAAYVVLRSVLARVHAISLRDRRGRVKLAARIIPMMRTHFGRDESCEDRIWSLLSSEALGLRQHWDTLTAEQAIANEVYHVAA